MTKTRVTDFDTSEYLEDEESIASYLNAILEENNPQLLVSAIGDIAKARGMSKIAADSGLGRESLYKALTAEAKPRFDTVLKVLSALGVSVSISPKPTARTGRRKKAGRSAPNHRSHPRIKKSKEAVRT